jgi:hypothetical protein
MIRVTRQRKRSVTPTRTPISSRYDGAVVPLTVGIVWAALIVYTTKTLCPDQIQREMAQDVLRPLR